MKTFEAEVCCLVFARVFVEAEDAKSARCKLQNGGGYWGEAEFEKHTARLDEIESIKEVE